MRVGRGRVWTISILGIDVKARSMQLDASSLPGGWCSLLLTWMPILMMLGSSSTLSWGWNMAITLAVGLNR